MNKRFILFFSFVLVFVFGFALGAFWRSFVDHSSVSARENVRVTPSNALSVPSSETIELSEAEARISKALEDPDFKRVHDLLQRERPVQMNLSTKEESEAPQERLPMGERPPVRFTLKSTE